MKSILELWSRYSEATKEVRAAIAAFAGGLLIVAGIIVEVPQASRSVLLNAPAWASDPKFLWAVAVGTVTAFSVWRILKAKPSNDEFANFLDGVSKVSMRAGMLCSIFLEILHIQRAISSIEPAKINRKYVIEELEISVANKVEYALGKEVRDKYLQIIRTAQRQTNYTHIIVETGLAYVSMVMMEELYKEMALCETLRLTA